MKKAFFWACTAFALIACTAIKEEEQLPPEEPQPQQEVEEPTVPEDGYKVLTVNASQTTGDTKTSYAGEVTFSWSVGDQISVLCNDGENNFWQTFTATTAAKSSAFTATVPVNVEMGPVDGTYKVAMFPASENHVYNGPWSLQYHIPAERDFRAASGGHASADIPMFAWGTAEDTYAFSNLSGAVKFSFSGLPFATAKCVFTVSGVKLNGNFGLLYDAIETANSSNVHWNVADAGNDSEKTVTYYADVVDGNVSFYVPYGAGSIWGFSTLQLIDAATAAVWYINDHVGTIPVAKNRVTVAPTINLGFASGFGIDWSVVPASVNTSETYKALKSLKAKADETYLYLYLEANPAYMCKDHDYDSYLQVFAESATGSSSYWGSTVYDQVSKDGWAVIGGNQAFETYEDENYSSHLVAHPETWYYEIRMKRSVNPILTAGGTVNIGVVLNDLYCDEPSTWARSNSWYPYGVIPTYGTALYPVEMPTTLALSFTEAAGEVQNPERGLYRHTEYKFNGGLPATINLTAYPNESLALLVFYLKDFIEEDHLSDAALTRIRDVFDKVRTANKKAIVRFAYTWEHEVDEVEIHPHEATPERILNHIEDVADILADNADILYLVQAGWIGTYGEWYYVEDPFVFSVSGSSVTGFENRAAVLDKVLEMLPPEIPVGLRTAFYKRYYLSPTAISTWTPLEAFGNDPNHRLAFFNDGFRGSENDIGTFKSDTDREMWYSQGNWFPCGGELSYRSAETFAGLSDDLKDCDQSIAEMRQQHFSYLHNSESNRFMAKWIEEGRLEDIKQALGYRLVLGDVEFSYASTTSGSTVNYSIKIENTGCAPVLSKRPFLLVLLHDGDAVELDDLGPIQEIAPGAPATELSGSFVLPQNIVAGDQLAIWAPDRDPGLRDIPAYSIHLANEEVTWTDGYNVLYTF